MNHPDRLCEQNVFVPKSPIVQYKRYLKENQEEKNYILLKWDSTKIDMTSTFTSITQSIF